MKLVNLNCPNCGGKTEFDENKEFGFCQHCGTKMMINDEVQQIKVENLTNIENLLILIKGAHSNKEGYEYCKKYLELNPNNPEVLLYKALYTRQSFTSSYEERVEEYRILLSVFSNIKNESEAKIYKLLREKKGYFEFNEMELRGLKEVFIKSYSIKKWENEVKHLFINLTEKINQEESGTLGCLLAIVVVVGIIVSMILT